MDWRLAHALNGSLRGHETAQWLVQHGASAAVALIAVATFALLLVPRLRVASVAALGSASVALLANQAIGQLWFRERPFTAHPSADLLLGAPSPDPSFPSDHATAAFAIAFAVFLAGRRVGAAFLLLAAWIALSRVLLGVHYPADVAAGALVGLAAALAVTTLARRYVALLAGLAGRIVDPLLLAARRVRPWIGPRTVGVAVLAASLLAFGQLAEDQATNDPITLTDVHLARWVSTNVGDGPADTSAVLTVGGGAVVLALVVLVAGGLLARARRWLDVALVLGAFALAQAATAALKLAFHRPRPAFGSAIPLPDGYSFPSGHASVSMAVYGALALIAVRALRSTAARGAAVAGTALLVLAIGGTRVLLDVHYLSDVLAGFALGLACLAAWALALDLVRRRPARTGRARIGATPLG